MTDKETLLAIFVVMVFVIIAALVWVPAADAQEVKYCKNYRTGEIFVVEKNQPCPYGTSL